MAPKLQDFEPLDYAIIGVVGVPALLSLAACMYTLPWWQGSRGSVKVTRDFNILWRGRVALSLLVALWAVSQLLRVSSLWGSNSLVFSDRVTRWTGAGWLCRIYLTAGLGILHPLCAFTALLMLTAALSRRHRPDELRHPNARLLGLALLCTLPVAAAQAVVAWIGLALTYRGQQLEALPRSVLGYFFAAYWQGTAEQCRTQARLVPPQQGGSSGGGNAATAAAQGSESGVLLAEPATATAADGSGACTLCVFPVAAVITHALFCAAFLAALWVTSSRLAAAVLNKRLKRRVRLFQATYSLLVVAGVAAMGISIVPGPFTWFNQVCWLVFVCTVALTVLLLEWEVVVWPVRDLRAVDKRLALWADATAAAAFAAAADELESHSSGSGLIKAHNRSAEAEAYVQAAAAARTLSAAPSQ